MTANKTHTSKIYGCVNISTSHDNEDDYELTHGITVWTHEALAVTMARDNIYLGKPLRLAQVVCTKEKPTYDHKETQGTGYFWLCPAEPEGHILRTFRHNEWIPVHEEEEGTMLYDISNSRILVRMIDGWHVLKTEKV